MNQNSRIIERNDALVSQIVKVRDPFCRIRLPGCEGKTVDPAHVHGRANMGTRWLLSAVFGACRACHSYIDTHYNEKEKIFKLIMGEKEYNKIKRLSFRTAKYFPYELKEINKYLKSIWDQCSDTMRT